MKLKLPDGKKFIFTIIDDTDDAFLNKIRPIYDLLYKNNIITTVLYILLIKIYYHL